MGQVWLAEQISPVRRQVALKLIKAGMYDEAVVQRFQAERQSLAIMDHPAIARVFDAGATPQGQPYFVMEYVPGLPITEYCDQKKLRSRERLHLLIQACEGVQHAHQKAIIHRDLKPANILVVEVDAKPTPRIIDFGLAKATTARVGGPSLLTQQGHFVGTPGYMSPEQADVRIEDIDTRTDVYSLGVVLYELLTGSRPFDAREGQKQALDQLLRKLREEEPPRPSSKVSADRDPSIAAARGTEPRLLIQLLRGDLDWIAMKALEKDRARRYGTPSELAADLRRYLKHEPVVARPASAAYQFRMYLRRHRIAASVAVAMALLLAAFSVVQAVELRRITRERDRADRVTAFMTGMFRVSNPSEARGNAISAREILDRSSAAIDASLAKDPELRARMMSEMGTVYENLGLYPKAEFLVKQAIEVERKVLGERHPETLASMNSLASVLAREGRSADAETLARHTLKESRQALGEKNALTLKAKNTLVTILTDEARYPEAERLARENLDAALVVLGSEHPDTVRYMANLARIESALGRSPEAEKLLRNAFEIQERLVGSEHPDTLLLMNNLAALLADGGHPAEAEKLQRKMLDIQRRMLGPEHLDSLMATSNLANYISDQGRYAEAADLYRETLQIERRVLGPEHPQTLETMDNLANALSELGHYEEAEQLGMGILQTRLRVDGPNHPSTATSAYNLACMFALQGNSGKALSFLRQSVDYGLPPQTALNLDQDSDLKSLHGAPGFQAVVSSAHQRAQSEHKSER